jgi:hypothetical protein
MGTNTANGIIIPDNGVEYKIVMDSKLSDQERQTILNDLQKLTNKTLTFNKNEVINGKSNGSNKPKGTLLIDRLIGSDKTVTVQITTKNPIEEDINPINATNGDGSDTTVKMNFNLQPKVLVRDSDSGNVIEEEAPSQIVFGHELIHADRSMRGEALNYNLKSNQGTNAKPDMVPQEERATVGVKHNTLKDITENDLRSEQNINLREQY